ncbi:MAG: hypothetical protein LBR77_09265 [Lachnospiraceae bacterium]|jgi:hypothetical protein|nr:hypothetical protein [Lachnospiraceae bacterium]
MTVARIIRLVASIAITIICIPYFFVYNPQYWYIGVLFIVIDIGNIINLVVGIMQNKAYKEERSKYDEMVSQYTTAYLSAPGTIRLYRRSDENGKSIKYLVYLNGQQAGVLADGETLTLTTNQAKNLLAASMQAVTQPDGTVADVPLQSYIYVDVAAGATTEALIQAGVFSQG